MIPTDSIVSCNELPTKKPKDTYAFRHPLLKVINSLNMLL